MDKKMKSISIAFHGRCYEITAYRAVAADDYDGKGREPVGSKVQWLAEGFTLVSEGGRHHDFKRETFYDTNLYPEEFMEANYADYCECVTSSGSGRMTVRIPDDEEFDPSKVCMVINEWYMPDTEDEMVYALLYDGRVCRLDADKVEPKDGSRLVAGENPNNPGLRFENNPNNNNSEPHDVKVNRQNAMAKTVDLEIYGIEYWVEALDEDGEGFEGRSAFSVEDTTFCVDGKEYVDSDFENAANLDSTDHINFCEDFDVRKFFIENEAVEGVLHTQKSFTSLEIEIPDDEEFDPAKLVLVTYDWIFPDGDDYIMLHSVVYDGVQYDDTCPQDGRGIGTDTIWSAEDEEED